MYRLSKDIELVALSPRFFEQISCSCLSREEQDLAPGQELADANRSFNAVHVRHDHVADDEFRLGLSCAVDCGRAGINGGRVESVLVENYGEGVGNHTFIVNDENSGLAGLAIR